MIIPKKLVLSYADRGRVVGVQIDDPSTVYSYNTSANKGGECTHRHICCACWPTSVACGCSV
jgi:hypothetical protein